MLESLTGYVLPPRVGSFTLTVRNMEHGVQWRADGFWRRRDESGPERGVTFTDVPVMRISSNTHHGEEPPEVYGVMRAAEMCDLHMQNVSCRKEFFSWRELMRGATEGTVPLSCWKGMRRYMEAGRFIIRKPKLEDNRVVPVYGFSMQRFSDREYLYSLFRRGFVDGVSADGILKECTERTLVRLVHIEITGDHYVLSY